MLQAIVKALRLPFRRKILFIQVSLLLIAVHLALRVVPFARVYRFMKRRQEIFAFLPSRSTVEDICWAVIRAERTWLGDRGCLAQALVGETLLVCQGFPAKMLIGVRKDETGTLLAHAWVEDENGQVMVGGKTSRFAFQQLPEIQYVLEQQRGCP